MQRFKEVYMYLRVSFLMSPLRRECLIGAPYPHPLVHLSTFGVTLQLMADHCSTTLQYKRGQ